MIMPQDFDPVDVLADLKHSVKELQKDLLLISSIQAVIAGELDPAVYHLTKDEAIAHFLSLYASGTENSVSEVILYVQRIEKWLKTAIAAVPTVKKAA